MIKIILYTQHIMRFPLVPEIRQHFKELINIFLLLREFHKLQFSEINKLKLHSLNTHVGYDLNFTIVFGEAYQRPTDILRAVQIISRGVYSDLIIFMPYRL